ncbi:MAG: hypothetical protein K9G49_09665 [Taibaiella sp.]|nr:hypothetical protein [Taibaiella sp.]
MSHDTNHAHSTENKAIISFKNSFWLAVILVGLFIASLNFVQAESAPEGHDAHGAATHDAHGAATHDAHSTGGHEAAPAHEVAPAPEVAPAAHGAEAAPEEAAPKSGH